MRENAETTKTRIVYDVSARERENTPSLNECLLTGPLLQSHLRSVLIRNRFHPVQSSPVHREQSASICTRSGAVPVSVERSYSTTLGNARISLPRKCQ